VLASAFVWQLVQVNPVCASWSNFECGSQRCVVFAVATGAMRPADAEATTFDMAAETLAGAEFVGLHRAMLVSGSFVCAIW